MSVPFAQSYTVTRVLAGGYAFGNHYDGLLLAPADLGAIAWQSGTTVRYSFSSVDLSGVTVGDSLIAYGCTTSANNGTFTITAVSDASNYVEITNALRTSATGNESNSPGKGAIISASGTESVTIRATIQPVTEWRQADRQLINMLGTEATEGLIRLHSQDQVYTAEKSPNQQPNRLAWQGQNYEIRWASHYDFGGLTHWRAVGSLIDEKTEGA